MEYDYDKAKGILDKSFPLIKVAFHKDCSSSDIILKCQECVWDHSDKNYEYYIADGSGSAICSNFNVDLSDGSRQSLPWTLNNYLRVSSIKYPSRLRLYCVRKLKTSMFLYSYL